MSDKLHISDFHFKSMVLLKCWPDSADSVRARIAEYMHVKSIPKMGEFIIKNDLYCAMLSPGHYMIFSNHDGLLSELSETISVDMAAIVDVSHSRQAIRLKGINSAQLLNKGIAIDLNDDNLPGLSALQSSVHSIGIILLKFKSDDYIIFSYSSFFESFYAWVIDSAAEYGYALS